MTIVVVFGIGERLQAIHGYQTLPNEVYTRAIEEEITETQEKGISTD